MLGRLVESACFEERSGERLVRLRIDGNDADRLLVVGDRLLPVAADRKLGAELVVWAM